MMNTPVNERRDGILNVYKQRGPTSHDVVEDIRHILHIKKAGHAGTLDPEAEGVLPVCVGKATKLSSLLSGSGKTYRAVMLLGVTTDTQDMTGRVISQCEADVDEDELKAAVLSFIGPYDQIPPMYSARKVQGRKLYELAREGREVERQPRTVEITSIAIDDIDMPHVTMTVDCSKGTYIRTLCHDIGRRLGCGACMESLLRTRVGQFTAEEALTVSEIKELYESGRLDEAMLPPDEIFSDIPAVRAIADTPADRLLHNGNPLPVSMAEATGQPYNSCGNVRMYDSAGGFIGEYRCDEEAGLYRPVTVFI